MHAIRISRDTAELLRADAIVFDLLPVGLEYQFDVDDEVYAALREISGDMDQAVRALCQVC